MTRRIRFFLFHLFCTFVIIVALGAAMLTIWFPEPYRSAAGGIALLTILGAVDVVLGPLMTLILVKPGKGLREITFDLSLVALIQFGALGYGIYSVYLARPVHTVFEIDRFKGVSANDVIIQDLPVASAEFRRLPLAGPTLIAAQKPTGQTQTQLANSFSLALAGFDISSQPKRWVPYASMLPEVLKASRPIAQLMGAYPALQPDLTALARAEKLPLDQLRFLPMVVHKAQWTAVLSPDASRILDYYPVDGFIDQKQAAPAAAGKP